MVRLHPYSRPSRCAQQHLSKADNSTILIPYIQIFLWQKWQGNHHYLLSSSLHVRHPPPTTSRWLFYPNQLSPPSGNACNPICTSHQAFGYATSSACSWSYSYSSATSSLTILLSATVDSISLLSLVMLLSSLNHRQFGWTSGRNLAVGRNRIPNLPPVPLRLIMR